MNGHEIRQVGDRTYWIKGETNVGLYRMSNGEVAVIDTGFEGHGQVIDALLTERGWRPCCIVNTHTHLDHMGGNRYLMEKYKIPAYCTRYEILFDEHADLEPAFFFGGFPARRLRSMFGHAQPCGVMPIEEARLEGLEFIDVAGHSPGMIGVGTDDGVWFLGDAYLGLGYLKNHTFGYAYRFDQYIQSMKRIRELEGCLFVPGHGRSETTIGETIQANLDNLERQVQRICSVCVEWTGFDEITQILSGDYDLPEDVGYYAMLCSYLRSFLSYLEDEDVLQSRFISGINKWCIK